MKSTKMVTEKQLAANRLNAKRSTGPRTERGKSYSRFNAVKTGLFAEHVVIPSCDGEDYRDGEPAKQFTELLGALQEEYKPQGPTEVFCVAQIAQCMWKQRRVTRSERGLVRAMTDIKPSVVMGKVAEDLSHKISVLEVVIKEVETNRADSPETYEALIPVLDVVLRGFHKIPLLETTNESSPDEAKLDRFVASLQQTEANLEDSFSDLMDKRQKAEYDDARALPREEDMDQILRCDKAWQKKFDWALQNLLKSQQRRRKSQARVGVPVLRALSPGQDGRKPARTYAMRSGK